MNTPVKNPAPILVYLAFATVYIVWGSTYFFIQKALHGFPPFLLGVFRFSTASLLLISWCKLRGENILDWKNIKPALISGILMLGLGNGIVIWVEQYISSGLVAIMVASAAIWFVILDKPKWSENLRSKSTIAGLVIGFIGVILLFGEQLMKALNTEQTHTQIIAMVLTVIGPACWAGGSIYSKYNTQPGYSVSVNTSWQMIAAACIFMPGVLFNGELNTFNWRNVPTDAWLSIAYLVVFGSILAFSAYVWLLKYRPATQVSTYAYVNPVVAVLLSLCFTNDKITLLQIIGLFIILGSVLLINLVKYRSSGKQQALPVHTKLSTS